MLPICNARQPSATSSRFDNRRRADNDALGVFMKTITILIGLVLSQMVNAAPQVLQTPESASGTAPTEHTLSGDLTLTPERLDSLIRYQTETVYRILGVDFSVKGVVPQAVRSRRPWQMINPFAPPEYGSGFHNVSVDPLTGRAEGIGLIGLGF
jgi:hypothetical protein